MPSPNSQVCKIDAIGPAGGAEGNRDQRPSKRNDVFCLSLPVFVFTYDYAHFITLLPADFLTIVF